MEEVKPIFRNDNSWIQTYWRPIMALTYTVICIWDFIAAPIFFQITGGNGISWKPLSLEGGGLFHVSMGAIIGITAWTRGVEKQKLIENFDKISNDKLDLNKDGFPDDVEQVTTKIAKKKRSYKDIVSGSE